MEITRRSRLLLRLQSWLFVVLFIALTGLLGWLSTQYIYQADWTAGGRNTISEDTRRLLDGMAEEIRITAFAREDELLRRQIQDLVGGYQRFKPDIRLEFVNPDTAPERARAEGIDADGELVIHYQGRSEKVRTLGEQQLTNSLLRISRQDERWIVFLSGHGERDPHGEANFDLGAFGKELERQGIRVQTLNLAESDIPENTHLLVIAGPRVRLLPGEIARLGEYVEGGGNLWWMAEPGRSAGLEPLAEQLGIEFLPGVIVDATTRLFGIDNPSFVVVTAYPNHEVTREMNAVSVFPEASAIGMLESEHWQVSPLLSTLNRSWSEIGELAGEIQYDEDSDERPGPLDIAVAVTRRAEGETEEAARAQRIIVTGDGDFLSNTYLGNAGNLDLGLNMVHWLSHDDAFIDIRVKAAPDTTLELGKAAQAGIAFGFLIGLPLLLLGSGLLIWWRRRGR